MTNVVALDRTEWKGAIAADTSAAALSSLEGGDVLFLPHLRFAIQRDEETLFTPSILGSSKNASYDSSTGRIGGTAASGRDAETLRALMARFSAAAAGLVDAVFPRYRGRIARARASFRPAEIAGRQTTWRKDDTRLHVDAFPATPSGGRRIMRVFTNVNPDGRVRAWRVGDDFENVARRFAPHLHVPIPGAGLVLAWLRVTKSPRTAYDALMLQLHDRMKQDDEFQRTSTQTAVEFPSGSTWLAFTDQVSHAAMSGQYQLEQTFLLPVDAMQSPALSPLRVLERLIGRALV